MQTIISILTITGYIAVGFVGFFVWLFLIGGALIAMRFKVNQKLDGWKK